MLQDSRRSRLIGVWCAAALVLEVCRNASPSDTSHSGVLLAIHVLPASVLFLLGRAAMLTSPAVVHSINPRQAVIPARVLTDRCHPIVLSGRTVIAAISAPCGTPKAACLP